MKKFLFLAALPLCFAVSCNVFFSNNTGEEGAVTLSIGEGGAYTGVFDEAASFGEPPAVYPDLGDPRIVIYDASGKALRSYAPGGGSSSWNFSLPPGGPYWVDFSAPVQHPANPLEDPFPFVKSFGATVKVDRVEAGSSRNLFLPLRVRETAIMAPYMPGEDSGVWVPFYDLPAEYPALAQDAYVNRNGVGELCLDFDPYGRLITTINATTNLYRVGGFKSADRKLISSPANLSPFYNVAFNLQDGSSYTTIELPFSKFDINGVFENWLEGAWNWVVNSQMLKGLDLSTFTIDEDGFFYNIKNDRIYRVKDGQSVSFPIADIIDPAGQEWAGTSEKPGILDMKALNGYLYVLLYVETGNSGSATYYDYFAAIPLDSIKDGTGRAAWIAGGKSVDDIHKGEGLQPFSRSLEGFFGPKKIVGWGPERICVYDQQGAPGAFHRIVEVDLRDRRISGAGLVVLQEE